MRYAGDYTWNASDGKDPLPNVGMTGERTISKNDSAGRDTSVIIVCIGHTFETNFDSDMI